jgi:FtsP/CotA-like multicopper oxidase with cupredoxin domain
MLDSCFNGTAHFAPVDTTITISNDGELPHTFTAVDGSFDSGQVSPGETFEITVDEPGIIQVFCTLHGTAQGQGMAGVLVVGEAEAPPVSAVNIAAIKQAVAEEDEAMIEAIDRQAKAIANLATVQASLTRGLQQPTASEDVVASPAPAIVTVPVESGTDSPWVALAAGLAVGLSGVAITAAYQSRRRQDLASGPDVLQPSPES